MCKLLIYVLLRSRHLLWFVNWVCTNNCTSKPCGIFVNYVIVHMPVINQLSAELFWRNINTKNVYVCTCVIFWHCKKAGPCFSIKNVFPGMGISIFRIRQSWDHLIFMGGIPTHVLVRWHLYIETVPSLLELVYKEDNNLHFLPSHYQCCWWPGDARSQGISRCGIDLGCMKYLIACRGKIKTS